MPRATRKAAPAGRKRRREPDDRVALRPRDDPGGRALEHRHVPRGLRERGQEGDRGRSAADDDDALARDVEVLGPLLRVDDRARELFAPRERGRVARVVAVVARARDHEAGGVAHRLLAARFVAAHGLDRPARVGARPVGAHHAMAEADVVDHSGLARRVLDVGADVAAVRDRLGVRPGPERVPHRQHVGVRADAGVAEQVPGAADALAPLEDREGLAGRVARQVPAGVDARETRADDQDVEVLDGTCGQGRSPPGRGRIRECRGSRPIRQIARSRRVGHREPAASQRAARPAGAGTYTAVFVGGSAITVVPPSGQVITTRSACDAAPSPKSRSPVGSPPRPEDDATSRV